MEGSHLSGSDHSIIDPGVTYDSEFRATATLLQGPVKITGGNRARCIASHDADYNSLDANCLPVAVP